MAETAALEARSQAPGAGRALAVERPAAAVPRELLTFRLGAQEYGIDAQKVQGLRGCRALTRIEAAPEGIPGAIKVDGALVPVADLRSWFKLDRIAEGMFTVAVILNLGGRVLGLMVDSVSDVVRLARRHIRPVPESWTGADVQYLIGIGVHDERKLILLDVEKLMLGEGVGLLVIEAC